MVCNIIDNCRCYAYDDEPEPMSNQFCGVRRGADVHSCPADCCAGGCPGQVKTDTPRHPFRIIPRPAQTKQFNVDHYDVILMILTTVTIVFLIYAT